MAKNPSTAHVIITMDGKSAVSVMRALQQEAAKTRKELEQMEKAGQIDTEDYKKKAEELKAMNTAINQNKHAYIDLKQIVDNLSGTTLRNLQTALKECRTASRTFADFRRPEYLKTIS